MVAEPMRTDRDPALAAAPGNHLVNAVGGHRRPVIHSQPQLRPVRLLMPGADPDIPVETAGGIMADPDDPRLAALATDCDLPAHRSTSLRSGSSESWQIPASSDSRMPAALNTAMI